MSLQNWNQYMYPTNLVNTHIPEIVYAIFSAKTMFGFDNVPSLNIVVICQGVEIFFHKL